MYIGRIFFLGIFFFPFSCFASPIDTVKNWGYQLQNIQAKDIRDAKHDLIVIDYSPDGSDENRFTKQEVAEMKKDGKLLIAYLSIGEAEMYRFYWNSQWESPKQTNCLKKYFNTLHQSYDWKNVCPKGNTGLVGEKNPDWDGNYSVKYWEKEWWDDAIVPYLNRIYSAGFDGVYLDLVDEYEYWSEKGMPEKKLADDMAKLIWKISLLSKRKMGKDFLIIPQNGISIIRVLGAKWKARYFSAIDAIALESLFFDTTKRERITRLLILKEYQKRGIPIFVVEYSRKKYLSRLLSRIKTYEKAYGISIIPFRAANDVQLNELYKPLRRK